MRKISICLVFLFLSGCGMIARQQLAERQAAAKAEMKQAMEACNQQFPTTSKQYVARNECQTKAATPVRAFAAYPDLFDKYWADRAVTAERLQAGKMTPAEAIQVTTSDMSSITEEEQRRNLASRSVGAQESMASAAWQASAPVSCTRYGTTTTCF